MSDERRPPSEYRWARQVWAVLLIGLVVVIVVLDVVVEGYEVSPPVLVPLLLAATAASLSPNLGSMLRHCQSAWSTSNGCATQAMPNSVPSTDLGRPRAASGSAVVRGSTQ